MSNKKILKADHLHNKLANNKTSDNKKKQHANPKTIRKGSRKATFQKQNEEYMQIQRHYLDSVEQQVLEQSVSWFSFLMQNFFFAFTLGALARQHVEYGKTNDGKSLIAKLSLPNSDVESSRNTKWIISHVMTSIQLPQVHIVTDTQCTKRLLLGAFSGPKSFNYQTRLGRKICRSSLLPKCASISLLRVLSFIEAEELTGT